MAAESKKVTTKLVTVRCGHPFRIGLIPFAGVCNKVTLSVQDIAKCIEHKALVVEHLANGNEIPLGFDNYDTYNGPTLIDDNAPVTKFEEHEIEMVGSDGKVKVINKQQTAKEETPVVKIDLESKRIEEQKKAEEEAAKKEEENKKAEKQKRINQIKEDQKRRDEEERKKALDAVLNREKEKSERKNSSSDVVQISLKKNDVVAEKEETQVEISGTLEVYAPEEPTTIEVPRVEEAAVMTPGVFDDNTNNQQNYEGKKKKKHH